jgi:NADPH:quinone reductase-like Zn-dependent oxidoreductase
VLRFIFNTFVPTITPMKAAVLHTFGKPPVYDNYPDPVPENEDQLVMTIKAASVKNLDKMRASGTHYASYTHLPAVVGIDGVGVLADGTRVYAQGIAGTIAEQALILKGRYVALPDGIDDATAAALPNAVIGAAMALRYRASIKKGDTVLVNGATGVTGQLAVQIARHYGASRIIATGRNAALLEKLKTMGADVTISLHQDDAAVIAQIKEEHAAKPIDIVIDYLWGHPVELIITALKGGGINAFTPVVKIVTVGSMAGEHIQLGSGILRSSAIELLGSGIGSISKEAMGKFITEVLPEMFQLVAEGKLHIETEIADLKDIETVWHKSIDAGKRLVIKM